MPGLSLGVKFLYRKNIKPYTLLLNVQGTFEKNSILFNLIWFDGRAICISLAPATSFIILQEPGNRSRRNLSFPASNFVAVFHELM